MRFLIVEDDFGSRRLLQTLLSPVAECETAVDGEEAVTAFQMSWKDNKPYQVIFLDIMLPKKDGQQALKEIRVLEKEMGITASDEVKVIMTTALEDPKNVIEAFHKGGASSYLVKPVTKDRIMEELRKLKVLA